MEWDLLIPATPEMILLLQAIVKHVDHRDSQLHDAGLSGTGGVAAGWHAWRKTR